MKKDLNFHVYVGTVRGAIAYSQCQNDVKTKFNLEEIDSEITCMEWGLKDDIIIGNKKGVVKHYDTNSDKYTGHVTDEIEGEGAIIGLGCFDNHLVIGRKNNVVNVWNKKKKVNDVFNINADERSILECMVYNNGRKIIATGGERNDLKLWDLETKEAVFKAKSLGHDELNLPIPTTVRGITFIPNEENLAACCTKEHKVLLYDERAQRRPVIKFTEAKASFTTITPAFRARQCLVGTTKGYMLLLDLRNGKCVKTFKSFTGSVTSIVCDPVEPLVAATSLDRHLRIYHLDTKELIYKEYLKMSLTNILMKPVIKTEPEDDGAKVRDVTDVEYEDMFSKMEEIDDRSLSKGKRKIKDAPEKNKKTKKEIDANANKNFIKKGSKGEKLINFLSIKRVSTKVDKSRMKTILN